MQVSALPWAPTPTDEQGYRRVLPVTCLHFGINMFTPAPVAQLVVQWTFNPRVASSSLAGGTRGQ